MRRITFLLIIFLIVGCGSRENSKILLRTGDFKIYVGPGVRPRILWAGGDAGCVEVEHWDDAREKWERMWAVFSLGSFWAGSGENTFISSPVTYGVLPSGAQDHVGQIIGYDSDLLDGWIFEDLVPGEKYRIAVLAPLCYPESSQTLGINDKGEPCINFWSSTLHFIR